MRAVPLGINYFNVKEKCKMAKLDGKVALITGAAAGLGEGISTAYAKHGAKLITVDLS